MIGLVSLEVYNSLFNITEENNKFELYTGYLEDEFSYTKLKDKVAQQKLVFQISHPRNWNMKYLDQISLKHIENYQRKRVTLRGVVYY